MWFGLACTSEDDWINNLRKLSIIMNSGET